MTQANVTGTVDPASPDHLTSVEQNLDSTVVRDWFMRAIATFAIAFLLCGGGSLIIYAIVSNLLGLVAKWMMHGYIPRAVWLFAAAESISAFVIVFAWILPKITIKVPQLQAAVTINDWSNGTNIIYGPGLHCRYWWESVHANSHIFLNDVTNTVTETIATLDGLMTITWMEIWAPRLSKADVFIGVGESTVNSGLSGYHKAFFSADLQHLTGQQARNAITILSKRAKSVFDLPPEEGEASLSVDPDLKEIERILEAKSPITRRRGSVPPKDLVQKKEDLYGIDMRNVIVIDIDFSKEIQKSRDTVAEADLARQALAKLRGIDLSTDAGEAEFQKFAASPEYKDYLSLWAVMSNQPNAKHTSYTFNGDAFKGLAGMDAAILARVAIAEQQGGGKGNKGGGKKKPK